MKKIIICLILMFSIGIILGSNAPSVEIEEENKNVEVRSVFLSYIELSRYLNDKNIAVAKGNIKEMLNNIYNLGFNEIIVQVRSFSDAIYKSDIYPWSRYISGVEGEDPGYDVLKEIISEAKKMGITVIAWINPYRIRNSEDTSDISVLNPAYKYLGTDVVYINNGIYYNPSKECVVDLIVKGIEEILINYKVDGILFDDYFYPNNEIDWADYENYLKNNEYISKEEYNLEVINGMVKKVHEVCKKYGVSFGISPDGNMENNYNKVFADVKEWCSSNLYIDFIMPQIYYGFENETKDFKKVLDEWESIIVSRDIDFRVALAFYKVGSEDIWAKSGKYEWTLNNDIMMREIILSRNVKNYQGFSLFRYDYIFYDEMYTEMTIKEIENMKKLLN